MGTSADDLFDKSGKNQNSLHYKYNKFLVSPYMPRGYNYSLFNSQTKVKENNDSKKSDFDDSLGDIQVHYPKPNYYNSIYTQRFSKKYKNFYNNNPYYVGSPTESYNYNNYQYINENNPLKIIENERKFNTVKTPDYQIKKEIQYQKTPEKYKKENGNIYLIDGQNNKYNNYKRYDDYYSSSNKIERYNSPVITKIAENNFINQDLNNKNLFLTPGEQDKKRRIYLSQINA